MSTRTEVTCDRCGKVWMTDKSVNTRMAGIGKFANLCKKCDAKYLALREHQQGEIDAFLEGKEGA